MTLLLQRSRAIDESLHEARGRAVAQIVVFTEPRARAEHLVRVAPLQLPDVVVVVQHGRAIPARKLAHGHAVGAVGEVEAVEDGLGGGVGVGDDDLLTEAG